MKLFNRKKSDASAIPDDLKPYYAANGAGVRRLIGPILRGLLLLVLVGLLVWGGIWAVSKIINRNSSSKSTSSSQTTASDNGSAANSTPSSGSTNKSTPSPTPTPVTTPSPVAPTTTPTPTSTPTPANSGATPTNGSQQTLTNTGPGEVVLLFTVASVIGVVVYRTVLLRKHM